jgi:mannose-6-phosphate isomerase
MTGSSGTRRIEPEFRTKIWGSAHIGPWFAPRPGEPVGEVWFPAHDLLIKFLFTSANLSIQVHPDDAYAGRHEKSRGKTEMWHILRADPGARIALGFKQASTAERIVAAAKSGEIVDLLNWIDVQPGETYFIPAGTVHAIGAGMALCEIQQNSDLTYRLFDYGRDRELHLRPASAVLQPDTHPGKSFPNDAGNGMQLLVECPYFRTYRVEVESSRGFGREHGIRFVVVLEGSGRINGLRASAGHVLESVDLKAWLIEPETDSDSGPMRLLLIA